jgi:3-oxoadipate enol-lactonase
MPWVEANGISTRYLIEGEGPLIVLVHEMGGTIESWDYVAPTLVEQGYRVLRYDMRNAGLSERRMDAFSFSDLADDLGALLDALNEKMALSICGCAFGGAVALCFAGQQPDRVQSVFAIAPAVGVAADRRAQVREKALSLLQEDLRVTQDARLVATWPAEARGDGAAFGDLWLRRVAADPQSIARQLLVLADADLSTELAAIACPVTVLAGRLDRERPPHIVAQTAQLIGGAVVFEEVESGHFMPFQSPEIVVLELEAHLKRLKS